MPRVAPFYCVKEQEKPHRDRVYHNNSLCQVGQRLKKTGWHLGTGGNRVCKVCAKINVEKL
jgi:hypothetical protein